LYAKVLRRFLSFFRRDVTRAPANDKCSCMVSIPRPLSFVIWQLGAYVKVSGIRFASSSLCDWSDHAAC
jgi:hypothetical protein